VAIVWSWQGISLPTGDSAFFGVLVRSGAFLGDGPELVILGSSIPEIIILPQIVEINGSVLSLSPSVMFDLLMVIDDDLNDIQFVERSIVGDSFGFDILFSLSNILPDSRIVSFYAIDIPYDRVSISRSFSIEVLPGPAFSQSPSMSWSVSVLLWFLPLLH
jgi:hypothetical protein